MPESDIFGGEPSIPALDVAPITPGAGLLVDPDLPGSPTYVARALVCGAGGLITFVTANGVTRTGFPLQAGYNPVGAQRVTAFAGTNLWGVKAG